MRKRLLGFSIALVLFSAFISVSAFIAQTRTRPTIERQPAGDLKVKYKVTMAGQTRESTTMIKGPRERSEEHNGYGGDTVNITQCDLKRTIQVSDSARKYIVTPMTGDDSAPTGGSGGTDTSGGESRRGGVVTYVSSAVDTGERKEMFGFNARHVKSSITMESSPDACSQMKQRIETDGWYIDLNVGLDCRLSRPPVAPNRTQGGCRDQVRSRRTGAGKVGYPLIETMTMYGPDGQVTFTTTKEVVELSREPLDAALFDVPSGYTEARSNQELYGMPSMDAIMAGRTDGATTGANMETSASPGATGARKPGTIRVGVAQINNKAGRPVSEDTLRGRLVGHIEGTGIEAIPLNASSPAEADAEAKAKQCDFVLYTDLVSLKSSAAKKLGGMFGRVTGVEGIDKTEARVDFRLFAVGETSPRLQSSATAKEEGDEASAGTAIDTEAGKVSAEVRKKGRS
jgi:hypothetical protein